MNPFDRGTVVKIWFGTDVVDENAFILDHPTQGLLDTGGNLTGDAGTDIRPWLYDVQITRGRSRELDRMQTGLCTLRMRNLDRGFDPFNAEYYLADEDGNFVLDEHGNYIIAPGPDRSDMFTPGKRVTVEVYGHVIFDGSTEDWNVIYEPHMRTDASVACVDALGVLARRELNEWTTTDGQMPGDRISEVLNRPEVLFGETRNLDVGGSALQGDTVTQGTNVLSYLNTIAESDFGALFASRNNRLTFKDRYSRITTDVAAVFSTEGDGIPIHGLELAVGSELFYNRVDVSRAGGSTRTANDTDSQTAYGIRKLSLSGLMMHSDEHAQSLAEFLVSIYGEPARRIAAIRVNLAALSDPADRGLVAGLDIGSVVEVTAQPLNAGTVISQTSIVEGVTHTLSHGQPHVMTLRLSPIWQAGEDPTVLFTLDDSLLDGDPVLAY